VYRGIYKTVMVYVSSSDHDLALIVGFLCASLSPQLGHSPHLADIYVVYRGQTAISPALIDLLNLINASEALLPPKAWCRPERKCGTKSQL